MLLPASGGAFKPLHASRANESNGQISPDGKWVVYSSDESGKWEIYASAFPSGDGEWQVSRGGGIEPRWSGDGKEIFYLTENSAMTAVSVNTKDGFSTGNPEPLFRTQLRAQVSSTDLYSYDVSKDGRRFLVDRYAKPTQITPLHVILNATAGLPK